jgi:hypothetical protein
LFLLLPHVWLLFYFYILIAVSSANSCLAAVPFLYSNGCFFCYLIAVRFIRMAVPFASSLLAAVPFVLIMAVPFATSLLTTVTFVFDICCSFYYLMYGRCSIFIFYCQLIAGRCSICT